MIRSIRRIDNVKDFDHELIYINQLCCFNNEKVNLLEEKNLNANISRKTGKFELRVEGRLINNNENQINILFDVNNISYQTKKIEVLSTDTNITVGEHINTTTTLELESYHDKEFNENSIYKAFIEVELEVMRSFHYRFETVTHTRNGTKYEYDCLRIDLNNKQYDVTQIKDNSKGYYIFECLQQQSYEEFSDACFAIQQAIGFVTKLMVGGEKYVFDKTGKLYYTNYIRPTIEALYSPIHTNPYSYLDIEKDVADKFLERLTIITLETLSKLVQKINTEPNFSAAILVIIEATSIRSLLIIPSCFAVIIEHFSKYFSKNEYGQQRPIANKDLSSKIIRELHLVIDNNSETLQDQTILKLKRRLNEINKPVNKEHLTNNEKLTRPFEQLNINLSLHDISIIEHRNDLLHGNILLDGGETDDIEKTNLYMSYVSAKLYTLISKLVLKSVGYDGYVYNQAKYLEKYMSVKTNEDYFERV